VITNAPLSVLIITLVLLFLTWKINNWYFRKQLNDKDAAIGLLEKRIQYETEAIYKPGDEKENDNGLVLTEDALADYITMGDHLFIEGMNQITDDTLDEWGQRIQGWAASVANYLRNNISEAKVSLFSSWEGMAPKKFHVAFSIEHNAHLQILERLLGNLRQVLRDLPQKHG